MPEVYRQAAVYVREIYAGIIRETEDGYQFSYAPSYLRLAEARPVSLTLPLKEDVYTSDAMFSFLDGLIPEGWLLDVASRNWKLDKNDRFGLLMVCCRDCIGDVSVREVPREV